MIYYVERCEPSIVVVRNAKTGLAYKYTVADDGTLYHDGPQYDLCDARDAATAYLAFYRNANPEFATAPL